MRNIWTICKKELFTLFTSWTAYIVLFFLLCLYGLFFYTGTLLSQQSKMNDVFSNLAIISFMFCPLLATKLIYEEKKNRTLSLLYASPVSILEVVLGKYLSVILFFLVPFSCSPFPLLSIYRSNRPSIGLRFSCSILDFFF